MAMNKTDMGEMMDDRSRKLLLAVMLFGAFLSVLNQTLLIGALPKIMADLDVTANQVQWLTTGFMLVNGIMIPITAFLINKLSNRHLFMGAMGIFAVGTCMGAFAPSFITLLLARVVQAIGAGIIMPTMQTVLMHIYPKEKRGYAMGIMGIVIGFAPAIGPTLSGFIVDHWSWHYIFYITTPVAVIDIIFAFFVMKNVTERSNPKLDVLSVIMSTLGFGGVLYGCSMAGSYGWLHPHAYIPILIGAVIVGFFVHRQLTIENPLLELRVCKNKCFVVGTLLAMFMFALMIAAENQLPMYIQTARGNTAMQSGLVLLPGALAMGLLSPLTGRLFDKFGPRLLALLGLSIVVVTTAMFIGITLETSLTVLTVIYAFRLMGICMITMPMTTWGLNSMENRYLAHGTAVNNTMRQLTGSIITAIMMTVMTTTISRTTASGAAADMAHAYVLGVKASFLVSTIICVILFILALVMVHDYDNIAEIHQKKPIRVK